MATGKTYQQTYAKPASDKTPARDQRLPVSPVRTFKGPKVNAGGSTGPGGSSSTDSASAKPQSK